MMNDKKQRVDFYVLQDTHELSILKTACKLAEKAYQQNHTVLILTENASYADKLNQLLWTFNDTSFIPHSDNPNDKAPLLVIAAEQKSISLTDHEILINLSPQFPESLQSFQRIIEIVDGTPENKQIARNKYKMYREKNCQLFSHQLN
jgi:DNA polymerase-3 subunit chi